MAPKTDLKQASGAAGARRAIRPAAQSVGRWRIVDQIGQGALARVCSARPIDGADDRPPAYALKMPHPARAEDPLALELLRTEATVCTHVVHPHLATVLAAQVQQPPYYLVMPLYEGETIAAALERETRLSPAIALWYARQTAEALAALHEAGWMHCDVKPSNVIVSPEGHATLVDLGFARRLHQATSPERHVAGTIDYMAPEMATSALQCDARTDVYSLGATLFEMLAGRAPFIGRDAGQTVQMQRQQMPPDLRDMAPGISEPLATLVRQMLSKHPLRRPQTARELVQQLARLEIASFGQRRINVGA